MLFRRKYKFCSLIIFCLIFTALFFVACSDEKEEIKLKITCSDSSDPSFFGEYTTDGDDDVGFTGTMSESASNIYTYEKTFDDIDSLEVQVTKTSDTATLIVKIYQGGDRKKYVQNDPESTSRTIDITYDYQDDDDNDDDDDDDNDVD